MYRNEAGVGDAIRASGCDRDDVYVTSKLSNASHRPDEARRAFNRTLSALGLDYVDLFLIHWPLPTLYGGDFVSTWKVLEEFHADGLARSIGVSNFQVEHLEDPRAGRAALAHPARKHRLPEVDDAIAGKENFQIFDFQLESDAVARIDALDQGEPGRIGANPDTFAFIPE